MKFSFVIPVYGTEQFLPRCLESLRAQTDGGFEAVVVDDGSPGGGAAAVVDALRDARFRTVRHETNRSLFQARQTGLQASTGDFVVPLDADDSIAPELVARLRREAAANPSADVIAYQMAMDDGRRLRKTKMRLGDERLTAEEARERLFASRLPCAICGKAVRRETYRTAMAQLGVGRDFYLNSSEDLCQTFPVLMNARAVSTLAYPGYRYRVNPASLTTTLADPAKMGKAAANTHLVFATLEDFVRRNGYDESLVAQLEKFAEPTLEWYLGCIRRLPEDAWRACAAELCRHFPPDLVARRAMTLIENSLTFKLGRLLTAWRSRRS